MRPSWFCYLIVWSSLVEQEAFLQSSPVEVELEATLPLTREAIESVRLDARLYAYDPFLADALGRSGRSDNHRSFDVSFGS